MNSQQELSKYIESGFKPHNKFMSAEDGKIKYIYERPPAVSLLNRAAANPIGICVNNIFYSLSPVYAGAGKDFMEELYKFEKLYDSRFEKELENYSADNPIGGKISEETAKRLNVFIDRDLRRAQIDILFGSLIKYEKPVDHKKFEPLFLRYIVESEDFSSETIKKDIEEHADELNFLILSEDLAYRYAADLLRDDKIVERITIYGKIKQLKYTQYRVSINYENNIAENISIDKDRLLRLIKYNDDVTGSALSVADRRKLNAQGIDAAKIKFNFDNIIKIEYGSYVFYEKAA